MYYNQEVNFTPEEVLMYLRKSRSDDPMLTVEDVLRNHEEILDNWCIHNLGSKIPAANKYREVVSGETLKDRPEINILLRKIENPRFKAVIVVEPQRLTRGDLEDIGRLMKLLKHTGTLIITPGKIYNLTDEYDFDSFERELKRGNDYLEYTKKILTRGRLLSVSQGNYIASIPPYGYDRTYIMDGKKKCPTLKENKEQADVVRLIFDMYVNQNMGCAKICNYLDKLGIKPPKKDHWSPVFVNSLLENIHYIGKVKWNWRKTVTTVVNSEILNTRPIAEDYLVYDGKHDAIVSEELFYKAHEKRGRMNRTKSSTKLINPFAGLVYCDCGRSMSMRVYKHKNGKQKADTRLICPEQTHCKNASCRYDDFLEIVCVALENNINDFDAKIENQNNDAVRLHQQLIKNLEKQLKLLEEKELAQWEAQSDPDETKRMPTHIFKALNEKLLKEKENTTNALRRAHETMPQQIDYKNTAVRFKDALRALKDDSIEPETKNVFLKSCIERIDYKRKRTDDNGHLKSEIELNIKLKI